MRRSYAGGEDSGRSHLHDASHAGPGRFPTRNLNAVITSYSIHYTKLYEVQIKNTNLGAITDFDGNYDLKANLEPGNYTLIFRSLGLTTQEIKISLGSQMEIVNDVTMATDILGLDEVVITGVGALTAKKQIGNTISSRNNFV